MIKEMLLVMIGACLGVSGYAQSGSDVTFSGSEKVKGTIENKNSLKAFEHQIADELQLFSDDIPNARKTAFGDGLYYNRPVGAIYHAFDRDMNGYREIRMYVPPFKSYGARAYAPESTDKLGWEFRTSSETTDANQYYNDQDGIFYMPEITPGIDYPLPVMIQGAKEFQLGEKNKYYRDIRDYSHYGSNASLVTMSFFDDHTSVKNIMGWGTLDNHYLFGTGTYQSGAYKSYGFLATFDAPAGPLYVQDVFSNVLSFSKTPIPKGKELVMRIYDPNNKEKVYGELTATADDLIYNEEASPESSKYGDVYFYNITFSHKVVNESGVTTVKPFVIDGPIAVMVRTDVEGVDLGFRGCLNPDEDKMPAAKQMVEKDGKVYNIIYGSSVSVPLYFTALFDGVKVKKDEDCNKVIFDNTGKAISEAVVYTAFPWYDFADGTTNVNLSGEAVYGFDELPDWVHLDAVDVSQWKSKDNRASNILKFSCDPLPQGVNSRMAEVRVVGRGVQSEDVIVLLQDEVAGISDVLTGNNIQVYKPAYNLSGQRVSKNYKGVILREGKKYLNK